jgi:hypothetical protein
VSILPYRIRQEKRINRLLKGSIFSPVRPPRPEMDLSLFAGGFFEQLAGYPLGFFLF